MNCLVNKSCMLQYALLCISMSVLFYITIHTPYIIVNNGKIITNGALYDPLLHNSSVLSDQLKSDFQFTYAEQELLLRCPCRSMDGKSQNISLCLPLQRPATATKEIFVFSIAKDDRWKHYNWSILTTVAWNEDKNLLCHAHRNNVKVVVKHNFNDVDKLCDVNSRKEWIKKTYMKIVDNYADGVNIDTERAMHGKYAKCLTLLVQELRVELKLHSLTEHAQISFDVSWAPRGVDDRYYDWKGLANASDLLFVMAYDMRSQIYDRCLAGANSPLALSKQGVTEYIYGFNISPQKLVFGVPWYGYQYICIGNSTKENSKYCEITPESFHGAPCSDAAGKQLNYEKIMKIIRSYPENPTDRLNLDEISQTPYFTYKNLTSGRQMQIWFDNPSSLMKKFKVAKDLNLLGVGMWHVDALAYVSNSSLEIDDTRNMWNTFDSFLND